MSGIIFFKTKNLEEITNFYMNRLDIKLWLKQPLCNILQSDQFIFGFQQSDHLENEGTLTFFFKTKEEVDYYYEKLKNISLGKPKENEKYHIYHFFAKDPEQRMVEIQCFLHELQPYQSGLSILKDRRSIRSFQKRELNRDLLEEVIELCQYAPSSHNSQSVYYQIIEDSPTLNWLSTLRDQSSSPLNKAPLAIAICANHLKTSLMEQDASIGATYFLLASHLHGLGTCWISGMNRPDVKERLNIPEYDYIACITPVGYPLENLTLPMRRRT